MKSHLIFALLFCSSFAYAANPNVVSLHNSQDEIEKVDLLINATQENLSRLQELRVLLIEYKKSENIAVNKPSDTDNILKLVNLAKAIHEDIIDGGLEDYFTPQFIEEIKKFSEISAKKHIPQAK
ncbi:MAG: hypothetical protein LLF94_05795 [Chlamydiales bacterium]|nr:hypothetical protein [Chlamydiales bacterium]